VARRILKAPGAARRAGLVLFGVAVLALSGCGVAATGDADRGRQLFVAKCGSCHTLAQADTGGTQGPDLDAAFAQARASGMDPDTIAGVVKAQVENPRPTTSNPSTSMPADLVTGEDLEDVASYVANVAGVPGIKPPPLGTPGELFASKCGSCHTLSTAGTSGTTGPDLDQAIPNMSAAEIKRSIVDPNAKLAPGFPPNVMPSTFGQDIPPKNLAALITYLMQNAGKTGKG
jgi:mono/diheme cytochrome c family protein